MSKPLSYSSANLLKSCSQRYYYYKVEEETPDPDYEDSTKAFDIGKAFHHVLENTLHTEKNVLTFLDQCPELFGLDHDENLLVTAMVFKYLKLHKASGLKVVHCELGLTTTQFIGFVDAIFLDEETGQWWICDLKTAASLGKDLSSRLHMDTQLNLYTYFVPKIANLLNLKEEDFAGIKYRVTTKSTAKKKKNETDKEYVKRLFGVISSYDFSIKKEFLNPNDFYNDHMKLYKKAQDLIAGRTKPTKNFANCFNYFRPCPYWSKCHGALFTEPNEAITVKEAKDF